MDRAIRQKSLGITVLEKKIYLTALFLFSNLWKI